MYKNKILLITGGTGSFGNAVMKRFINSEIKEIRIFSRDEKKQDDMRKKFNNVKLKFYIGDVRDYQSVSTAMRNVDYVFHASALKQVPSCEFFPIEAVKTNILGTENVLNSAIEHGVKKVICLSTDKAVYPINAMGISKAMMEKVFLAKSRLDLDIETVICGTRYGNVMGSRGSVIPLFVKQAKTNNSITITNPEMTRFLMSLDQAVELVEFAFENANGGDIMVQKADSCKIIDLAKAIKKIFKSKSEIKIIGTRHGEKLYESLLTKEELSIAEDMGDFYRISIDKRDLNYDKYFDKGNKIELKNHDYNSHSVNILTVDEIVNRLLKLDFILEEIKGLDN
jgi:UDP-N-acetylglucosamine 4,6-dehydratase